MFYKNLYFYFTLSVFTVTGSVILYFINLTQSSAYIDEIFHIPQCQEYCKGNFLKYDPKLTTPPGLYIITISILLPLSKFFQVNLCTLGILRGVNFVASILLLILINQMLHTKVRKNTHYSSIKIPWLALNLTTLPVLYFLSFIYYTDVTSTFFVLLTQYLYNLGKSHTAGLAGFIAVLIRQNNIIWFCGFAFIKCCEQMEKEIQKTGQRIVQTERKKISYIQIILKKSLLLLIRGSFLQVLSVILKETYFFFLTTFIFLYLFLMNGSLVLGDKNAHKAVIHIPQLFYFSLFTSVFAFPFCIYPCLKFVNNVRKFKLTVILSVLAIASILFLNTMTHLYLISDNRHYTFYIWKRFLDHPVIKFVFIPIYVVSIYSIFQNISHLNGYTKLSYLLSTFLCLVPHKLLEFRYFIVPYLLYRIEASIQVTLWQLAIESILNILVNYLTLSLFLWSPFQWPDGSIQRFCW